MISWKKPHHPMRLLRLQIIERENKKPNRPRLWIHNTNHELKRRIHTFYIKKVCEERLAEEVKAKARRESDAANI